MQGRKVVMGKVDACDAAGTMVELARKPGDPVRGVSCADARVAQGPEFRRRCQRYECATSLVSLIQVFASLVAPCVAPGAGSVARWRASQCVGLGAPAGCTRTEETKIQSKQGRSVVDVFESDASSLCCVAHPTPPPLFPHPPAHSHRLRRGRARR